MKLQEQVLRIKSIMGVIKEQQEMTFQQYMDQLLENPVEFLNKLNTDEQFKNAYIKSYGEDKYGNPNFDLLEEAKLKYLLSNGVKSTGQVKDDTTNEVIMNYEVSTYDELLKINQFMEDEKSKGRKVIRVGYTGRLDGVRNGKEVAQALNVPLRDTWFK